jgi:hypothetical protein
MSASRVVVGKVILVEDCIASIHGGTNKGNSLITGVKALNITRRTTQTLKERSGS